MIFPENHNCNAHDEQFKIEMKNKLNGKLEKKLQRYKNTSLFHSNKNTSVQLLSIKTESNEEIDV